MRLVIGIVVAVLAFLPAHAVELGDDGLHKAAWLRITSKNLTEDLAAANSENKRLAIIFEQRGCIYCKEMHQKVFPIPEIDTFITENFFFIQMDLFGGGSVTDMDGDVLSERRIAQKWGVRFTPTMLFFDDNAVPDMDATQSLVAVMPGAIDEDVTLNLLTWVVDRGYESDESFPDYHARRLAEADFEE